MNTAVNKNNNEQLHGQLHGLLLVDKPGLAELSSAYLAASNDQPDRSDQPEQPNQPIRLPTSHDIVNRVRRWSNEKRIGHTGTLDPMASGVLVLTIGNATRLTEYHQGHDKHYIAEIKLGEETDTYDQTGTVTETAPVPVLTLSQIETALAQFRGSIMQMPPAYSAIKQGGKTAYQQARKGKEISLDPRPVHFYQLDLLEFTPPATIRLDIRCSTGTYIRSLAHDLGIALGTVATLSYLRRIAVGPFIIDQTHRLEEIEQKALAGELAQWLQPSAYGLLLPKVQLDDISMRRLGFGQQVKMPLEWFAALPSEENQLPVNQLPANQLPTKGLLAQAISPSGELSGIICCTNVPPQDETGQQIVWRADKWFTDSQTLNIDLNND